MKTAIPKFLATLATGLMSGAFLYGLLNLVPTFYEVPMDVHLTFRIQLMNHNSLTMQLLMAISIITPIWYALVNSRLKGVMVFSILSAILALTALLVTRFGNVPINVLMRTWSAINPPEDWRHHLHLWDMYNVVRCIAAAGSFVSFTGATHLAFLHKNNSDTAR